MRDVSRYPMRCAIAKLARSPRPETARLTRPESTSLRQVKDPAHDRSWYLTTPIDPDLLALSDVTTCRMDSPYQAEFFTANS
jgi:hypothetical protein